MSTPITAQSLIRGIDRILIHTQDVERVFGRFRHEFGLPVVWPIADCGLLVSGGLYAGNMTIEIGRFADLIFLELASTGSASHHGSRHGRR